MMRIQNRAKGFTLIELIMVMVITGILVAIIAMFMKQPVDAYFDSARRAALTDEADTAIRRMARDIHKALPNSVRQLNNQCIEFIPTKIGGRYRAAVDALGNGDILDFNTVGGDTTFNMFGSNNALPADQRIVVDDVIAVYNLGVAGASAYNLDNTATVAIAPVEAGNPVETTITIDSNVATIALDPMLFPFASSSRRFYVIPNNEQIVSFVCLNGTLFRNANYALGAACPAPTPGTTPVLAQHVSFCDFVYSSSDPRNALVQITITLTDGGETISLYHEAHVNNSP